MSEEQITKEVNNPDELLQLDQDVIELQKLVNAAPYIKSPVDITLSKSFPK